MKKPTSAFTLIELLIVIALMGALVGLISGNFFNSLKKGRDVRRKADLQNVQKALELYYEDKKTYPLTDQLNFGDSLCEIPSDCTSGRIYMQKLPIDPSPSCQYAYVSEDGNNYYLYSSIENNQDVGPGVAKDASGNQDEYSVDCGCGNCKFGVTSSNVSL